MSTEFALMRRTVAEEASRPNMADQKDPPVEANENSAIGLVELLLKNPTRVDELARDEGRQWELVPRFLTIALASYTVYSLAMIVILGCVPSAAMPKMLPARWSPQSAVGLWFGYNVSLIAASGVCLPSFYFYSLMAGIKISAVQITGQVLKGSAATGVMLLGILPIYVAVVLGMIVLSADPASLEGMLYFGLGLPALAGLWGVRSIFVGVMGFADTLAANRRCRRTCFLRRLTLAWAACYSAVMPVMVYKLWQLFAGVLA